MAVRSASPLCSFTVAVHGPAGICPSSANETGLTSPGAIVVPRFARNGPACRPPGPLVNVSSPDMSNARPPVLWISVPIISRPSSRRLAVSAAMVKPAAGGPPGPMSRYIRIPTRLTIWNPLPSGAALPACAQSTP